MDSAKPEQAVNDVSKTVQLVADLHEFGVALYRQRMVREFGAEAADERVRAWLAEYEPPAEWRLASRQWARP